MWHAFISFMKFMSHVEDGLMDIRAKHPVFSMLFFWGSVAGLIVYSVWVFSR